ncbi:MAG: hypothetical protein ABJA18_09430 [bacterium]
MLIKRSDLLTSPGLLISLSLLLINDFLLKAIFNNPLTGKLSDFAGIFAFSLFWIAVFPDLARSACLVVALSFAFWKTSYSEPIINLWNGLGVIRFSRTVDLTDLVALSVIPFALFYSTRAFKRKQTEPKWLLTSIALISIFAFTATSYRTKYEDYSNKYYFAGSKGELFKKIDDLHLTYFDLPLGKDEMESGRLEFNIPSSMCFDSIDADLEVVEVDSQTIVSIKKLEHHCPQRAGDREKLLAEFEKEFIERLKNGTPQTKHFKSDVETPGFKPPPAQYPTPLRASPAPAPGKS